MLIRLVFVDLHVQVIKVIKMFACLTGLYYFETVQYMTFISGLSDMINLTN